MNVISFETVPEDTSLSVGGEVSLLCSVIGEGLNKLIWVRTDSGKYVNVISDLVICYPYCLGRTIETVGV